MNNMDVESTLGILGLCYDSVKHIEDNLFIVELNKKFGIVDDENSEIIKVDKKGIHKLNNRKAVVEENTGFYVVSLDNPENRTRCNITGIKDTGLCYKITDSGLYGIMNYDGDIVIPTIYRKIWKIRETYNCSYIEGAILDSVINTGKYSDKIECYPVKMEKGFRNPEYVYAIDTVYSEVELVGVCDINTDIRGIWSKDKLKCRVRVGGKIIGPKIDRIIPDRELYKQGILRGQDDKTRTQCFISLKGQTLVDIGKYSKIEYIGNKLCIVYKGPWKGTLFNWKMAIPDDKIAEIKKDKKSSIYTAVIDTKRYYIGNDGMAYEDITMAFPIYKSTIKENLYMIGLYGNWLFCNSEFKYISKERIRGELREGKNWVKLNQ